MASKLKALAWNKDEETTQRRIDHRDPRDAHQGALVEQFPGSFSK